MKEFNWAEHSEKIVKERLKNHGGMKEAIVAMDAQIASLKVEADEYCLRDCWGVR